jgi:hypothetical protein
LTDLLEAMASFSFLGHVLELGALAAPYIRRVWSACDGDANQAAKVLGWGSDWLAETAITV